MLRLSVTNRFVLLNASGGTTRKPPPHSEEESLFIARLTPSLRPVVSISTQNPGALTSTLPLTTFSVRPPKIRAAHVFSFLCSCPSPPILVINLYFVYPLFSFFEPPCKYSTGPLGLKYVPLDVSHNVPSISFPVFLEITVTSIQRLSLTFDFFSSRMFHHLCRLFLT